VKNNLKKSVKNNGTRADYPKTVTVQIRKYIITTYAEFVVRIPRNRLKQKQTKKQNKNARVTRLPRSNATRLYFTDRVRTTCARGLRVRSLLSSARGTRIVRLRGLHSRRSRNLLRHFALARLFIGYIF